MRDVIIGNIRIGEGQRPLVIPEIGINHNGSLAVAKEMVDAAARAGARLIKHQTHVVDDEMAPCARQVKPGNADVSIYEVMSRAALTPNSGSSTLEVIMTSSLKAQGLSAR